ncbi:type II secretion system protein [Mucisphaera calidilacus]|uniref:DUF1559 domain-containing protein n=1 Tax=Mucisphaera calidilacus TaxID=2527982 RepID=A0A518C0R5_9BACT|nr:type II secretion system protein [Mucisphaera calidilacus]QDU72822.1 hypothetical protein Pan265_26970 [Mucisphaera calidilacus]
MRQHARAAFTLIELLVTVAIIGLLVAITLPAMAQARTLARATQCAVNLRSVGQAMLVYEVDHQRLPMHAVEASGGPANQMWCIKTAAFDGRELYRPYMPLDYFHCPFHPEHDYDNAPAVNQYSNYALTPGYVFRNIDAATDAPQRWQQSDTPWTCITDTTTTRSLNVSPPTRCTATPPDSYDVVNHATDAGFELIEMNTPSAYGTAYKRTGGNTRRGHTFNAVLTDGSVAAHQGNDPSVIDVTDRTGTGSLLMPASD